MDNKVAGQCQDRRKSVTTEKITLRLTACDIRIKVSICRPQAMVLGVIVTSDY
jgi:hypothetical protein